MKLLIPLTILLAAASTVQAQLIAEESFLVGNGAGLYKADTNLAAPAQPAPDVITGIQDWASTNTFIPFFPKAGSLSFGGGEARLATKGGKLEGNTGGVSHIALMNVATDGPFKDYINPAVTPLAIGSADTGVLYISALVRIERLESNQSFMALGVENATRNGLQNERTIKFGQNWGSSTFNLSGNVPLDSDTHLYVAKMEYKSGTDSYTVWFDPDLTKSEAQLTPAATGSAELKFSAIGFQGQISQPITLPDGTTTNMPNFNVDEIRFGKTYNDVVPLAVLYNFTIVQTDNGTVSSDVPTGKVQDGSSIKLTTVAAAGFRFKEWTNGVPEDDKTKPNPTIVVTADTVVSAAFEAIPSYIVTLEANPEAGGTVDMDPVSPVLEDTEVTIIATANEGYIFKNWTVGAQTYTSNPLARVITADQTVTANFVSSALTVDPTSASFPSAGGQSSITVTTEVAWTATKDAAWITIETGASGTGNGTVNYTVAANTGEARSGKITVNTVDVTINQAEYAPPPPTSIFAAPCSADFGSGFKWNSAFGYFYDGFYPFIYSFDQAAWLYVYHTTGLTETDGYFLYDFKQAKFGYTGCTYYPTITYY